MSVLSISSPGVHFGDDTAARRLARHVNDAGAEVRRARPTVPDQTGNLWFDLAGTPFPHQVPAFERAFGTDRLLYGSDYCWTPPPAVDAQLATIDAAVCTPSFPVVR
ncbi:hypothetical protein [Amycolatopsis sp. cmx-4-68]|uniref:hypothetical protein n=1 Tax=Amycolatopsis sp. cmx-4-68 TaxID=2790938 RepID=UPI00397D8EE4